jgi:hypothetical protein
MPKYRPISIGHEYTKDPELTSSLLASKKLMISYQH